MNATKPLDPNLMHAPKANRNTPFKLTKGVLVKKKAKCSDCGGVCTIGSVGNITHGYYTNGKEKLCRLCARKCRIV